MRPSIGLAGGTALGDAPPLVRELATAGLWLEQETIVLDSRLCSALEASLRPFHDTVSELYPTPPLEPVAAALERTADFPRSCVSIGRCPALPFFFLPDRPGPLDVRADSRSLRLLAQSKNSR
jgi:hypothetical protein